MVPAIKNRRLVIFEGVCTDTENPLTRRVFFCYHVQMIELVILSVVLISLVEALDKRERENLTMMRFYNLMRAFEA